MTAIHQSESSSILNLTYPQSLRNHTFTLPQSFIPYHVSRSPVILMLHAFGPTIPTGEMIRAVAMAVGIAYDKIDECGGEVVMAKGLFVYSHEFTNRDEIILTVSDFRETGGPMTYFNLRDALRGVGEFFLRQRGAQELQFEVDVENMGYRGTGHVDYKPARPSTSAVA